MSVVINHHILCSFSNLLCKIVTSLCVSIYFIISGVTEVEIPSQVFLFRFILLQEGMTNGDALFQLLTYFILKYSVEGTLNI